MRFLQKDSRRDSQSLYLVGVLPAVAGGVIKEVHVPVCGYCDWIGRVLSENKADIFRLYLRYLEEDTELKMQTSELFCCHSIWSQGPPESPRYILRAILELPLGIFKHRPGERDSWPLADLGTC
jgi:hypothetical protein